MGIIGTSSFKLGTDSTLNNISKMLIGDALFYNKVLSDNEIVKNYSTSMNIIYDSLEAGYHNFTPMTLKEYYMSSKNGTLINNADISSMYVWIPRFKYRVFNILGEDKNDSYDAYHKGIDIVFENLTASSGAIYCENNECYNDNLKTIKVSNYDNGKYYTHPAFSSVTDELTGLWVSKYEISSNMESKKGNQVVTDDYLSNYYKKIKNMSNIDDYHVIKNTEWGSIAYLTHSKYGLCKNNVCAKIGDNTTYISGNESTDTTTGNVYGVFDMSGSAKEYTMGNITTTGTLNLDNAYFNEVPIGTNDYDLYLANTFILGDATKELSLGDKNWYDSSIDVTDGSWFIRDSLYGYGTSNDINNSNLTTRIVIK